LQKKIKTRRDIEFADQKAETLGWGHYFKLSRRKIRNLYSDDTKSDWYWVEAAHSPFYDAVVLLLYVESPGEPVALYLRRSLRPAVAFRRFSPLHLQSDNGEHLAEIWELPAGGIEKVDLEPGGGGPRARAVAEAWEEAGFKVQEEDLIPLGKAPYSAPALAGERLNYYICKVNPEDAQPPQGDGHPMETGSELVLLPLPEALQWIDQGKVSDLKTEVGIRRFAAWLGKNRVRTPQTSDRSAFG
jgi:8-oxo-dGTP pyrophosphatase MutT (NUDIX family)